MTRGVDATFDPADPLPFLGLHSHASAGAAVQHLAWQALEAQIHLCIGKVVEPGEDW